MRITPAREARALASAESAHAAQPVTDLADHLRAAIPFDAKGLARALQAAIIPCSLGYALVATTKRGIAAILLGDTADDLMRDLKTRFPEAALTEADTRTTRLAEGALAFIEDPTRPFDLPLDIAGSLFQHRVWRAIREIPRGTTSSYSDIAIAIGKPQAVRAVAAACGQNPVAIAIPCHRVVRADGALAGYRWGLARKRALLAREQQAR